jgi:hypothetical protein
VAISLVDATEQGWNARTGATAWTFAGAYSHPGAADVAQVAVNIPGTSSGGSIPCIMMHGLDPATGTDEWTVDFRDFKDVDNNGKPVDQCDSDGNSGPPDITKAAGTGITLICAKAQYNNHGKCFYAGTPTAVSSDMANTDKFDPVTGDYVTGDGNSGISPIQVFDRGGVLIYTISHDKAENLGLTVAGIFNGYLYTTTKTGHPVVNLTNGQLVVDDYRGPLPVSIVSGYTVDAGGSLTKGAFVPHG